MLQRQETFIDTGSSVRGSGSFSKHHFTESTGSRAQRRSAGMAAFGEDLWPAGFSLVLADGIECRGQC